MRSKSVGRAAPAFRPVYELTGAEWHPPALIEADRRDPEAGTGGNGWRSGSPPGGSGAQDGMSDRWSAGEFEW
jgi:hypothetical protein